MAERANNGLLKLFTTIIVSGVAGTLITVGIVYATLCGGVDSNKEDIDAMKPVVTDNRESIIGIKKDIAQILKTQNQMILDDKENTKAILKAIEGLNNGN